MNCQFCNKLCKNSNSLRNHERLCKLNPNRQILPSNFIKYHEKLKSGEVVKVYTNQFVKAKLQGKTYSFSEETRKKLSENNKNRKLDSITKEKISVSRSKYLEEVGGGGFTHIKYYDATNLLGEMYKVRGTWELRIAEWLNTNNIVWKRKIYIPYEIDGVNRTYTPDFYLPDKDIYLEVKGYYSEFDKQKLRRVVSQNSIELFLIQADVIGNLPVIVDIDNLLVNKIV